MGPLQQQEAVGEAPRPGEAGPVQPSLAALAARRHGLQSSLSVGILVCAGGKPHGPMERKISKRLREAEEGRPQWKASWRVRPWKNRSMPPTQSPLRPDEASGTTSSRVTLYAAIFA